MTGRSGSGPRSVGPALLALGLAALGMGVSAAGARLGVPALERWVGPGLTLGGAAVWGVARWRGRGT